MSEHIMWNSASVYDYFLNDSYECSTCRMLLNDNKTFEANGKVYCDNCFKSK
ncbi:LIM domain-containing protein [Peribacillus alkalitolerans]|uniref:LIM domain-containing protein n=1 Tax=Peribacillus alkalitolerans TaxID=1550385 RepID=UPI0013D433FA|nr:LIM domain-containing protein [Peribacillus alkalitolerans]